MMLLVVANRLPGKVAFIPCSMAYQRIIILLQSVGLSNRAVGLVSTGPHFGAPKLFLQFAAGLADRLAATCSVVKLHVQCKD